MSVSGSSYEKLVRMILEIRRTIIQANTDGAGRLEMDSTDARIVAMINDHFRYRDDFDSIADSARDAL